MESLLVLLALLPIALLVLMIILISRMTALSRELRWMRERMASMPTGAFTPQEEPSYAPPPIITPPPEPPVIWEEKAITPEPIYHEPIPEPVAEFVEPEPEPVSPAEPPPPPPPPRPSFFERHPDLEKFIGENLINKIGITVLVIGIGLLLRYAIGKGLISETGRTLIGLLAGGVLVFFAHRSRTNFRAFSSVLVAGGIAVFYFTIAIAFHQYQLIGQLPAFAIMVLITALAVLFTLAYDRKELAVIALLGGFASPFMVSSGEGNFRVLFTYLLILDVGMLVLANYKKWHVINVLSFALSILIFGAWALTEYPEMDPRPTLLGFSFATAFFLVFFGMNLRYNLRHKQTFAALDHALLVVNTAAFYGLGIYFLSDLHLRVTGLFTVLLGLFYLGFALYFHRREGIPSTLKFLLIGLVLTFISLAAPVQLEGNHITLFWAAEAVLLFWFAQRSGLRLVEKGGLLVTVLMLISLAMDLDDVYGWNDIDVLRPLLNKGWITGMVSATALGAMTILLRRRERDHVILGTLKAPLLAAITAVAGIVVLYTTGYLELAHQLGTRVDPGVVTKALMAYSLLFVIALDLVSRRAITVYRIAVGALYVLLGLIYISVFYESSSYPSWAAQRLDGSTGFLAFHYLAFALMLIAVVRFVVIVRAHMDRSSRGWNIYLWGLCAFLVVFASQELDHVLLLGGSGESSPYATLQDGRRVGYPILWGLGSFLFMWYGMRRRLRMVRVIALCLFAITLVKLFLFDLGALSEGGRVAAFIFLGALLLVISFMYQKLKVLLQDDAPPSPIPDEATS